MENNYQATVSSVDAPAVEKKERKRRQRHGQNVLIGNKQQVWDGHAQMTGGKLKKDDLMECPKTKKIISKKKHASGLALMERAKKAKEDPEDPLHQKFVNFFEHQYKKKPKDIVKASSEETLEKPKKQRRKKQTKSVEVDTQPSEPVQVVS